MNGLMCQYVCEFWVADMSECMTDKVGGGSE